MSKAKLTDFRNQQKLKDEQINYLLGDLEKSLEDYKQALEVREKQLLEAKKYYYLPKKALINLLLKIEILKPTFKI